MLWQQMKLAGVELADWQREHRFAPPRRWRFDLAHPSIQLAVELEGLTREGGRHQRIPGFVGDARKYLAAILAGWRVLRVPRELVLDLTAVRAICQLLRVECRL